MDKKAYFEALKKESKPVEGQPNIYFSKKKKMSFRMPTSFEEEKPPVWVPEQTKAKSKSILQKKAVLDQWTKENAK